jgi:hypothetical protein
LWCHVMVAILDIWWISEKNNFKIILKWRSSPIWWPPLQNYFKIILFWNPSDIQYGHHHMASQVPYKVFFLMCIWNSRWPPLQNYFKIILFWNPSDIQYGHHHKSLTKFFFLCASEKFWSGGHLEFQMHIRKKTL